MAKAQAALAAGHGAEAGDLFRQALGTAPEDWALWIGLARAALLDKPAEWTAQQRLREQASGAAINAYLMSDGDTQRAVALALLGQSLAARALWRPAIQADRASLALADNAEVRARYERLNARHGFRLIDHRVDADAASPRICLQFSQPLAHQRTDLADFVAVPERTGLAIEAEEQQICVDGVQHGERYRIQVRAGLPAADGERLARSTELSVYVRDRPPAVRFLGRAYVLPRGEAATIPLVSVNTTEIEAELLRIGDRSLARIIGDGLFLGSLAEYERDRIAQRTGERVWTGRVEVQAPLNRDVTTAIPVGTLVPDLAPGVYVLTAWPAGRDDAETAATQWLVVSDIGLGALSGRDGLHLVARALSTAAPLAEIRLRLVARNDEVLAEAVTDDAGYARFAPGLLRGTGGMAPALVVAEAADGDYGFLDLTRPPFDLSDRGVAGRPAPKPVDVYLVTERGVYRPGERVQITALARDAQARAVVGLPLTLVIRRPDGLEHSRTLTEDRGLGGHELAVDLPPEAMRGTWRVTAYGDPQGPALAERPFAVEDFRPERLAFELELPEAPLSPASLPPLAVAARFLYGAPGAELAVSGGIELRSVTELAAFPGFRFGLVDEEAAPVSAPIASQRTDAAGQTELGLQLPDAVPGSRPQIAEIRIEVADAGGRPVERTIRRPLRDPAPRLGIRPLFAERAEQGGTAGFELIGVDPDGARVPVAQVDWTLSKVERTFQWYRIDGRWDYEPVVGRQRVASGSLPLVQDAPGRIEAKVDWGEYVLEVAAADGGLLPASFAFSAGWQIAPTAVDTPDVLQVTLDRPSYRVGDRARVRLTPRFAGQALVMVLDDRLISSTPVAVPAEGTTLELPVTDEWGPGAYVTAVLYRPMDLAAKQMPARAIGVAWAGVEPGGRRLALRLEPPAVARPRGPIEVALAVDGLAAGEEVYVTLAAVDLGILNLTRYAAPAPADWYLGQRRLGMELRDLYGQLIDRMQGVPGLVRSGGDAGLLHLTGPPPTEALLALHSGIRRLDRNGRASVALDLPDFNGTVRLMAMAWSAEGVGQAVADLVVRDPVVIEAALPGFLAVGDRSSLRLDLTQVEGEPGDAALGVTSERGHIQTDAAHASQRVSLAPSARTPALVPIDARSSGTERLTVFVKTHAGQVLRKTLTVAVRDPVPPVAAPSIVPLPPGGGLRVRIDDLGDLAPGGGPSACPSPGPSASTCRASSGI